MRIQDFLREHNSPVPPKRDPPDKVLIDRLLAYLTPYSPTEAEAITGFSYQTITNYRKGAWARLEFATRRRIAAFLADPPSPDEADRRIEEWRATQPSGARVADRGRKEADALRKAKGPKVPRKKQA